MKRMRKAAAFFILSILIFTGCVAKETTPDVLKDGDVIGNGDTCFHFVIEDEKEEQIEVEVKTKEKTVGEALQKLHVISGTEGDYGLYIETVNGVTADYEKDQKYWAFYIDGEYAQQGIDQTKIQPDSTYLLKMETALTE